jgi:imidazolonepropionase-like amidohydrolase
MSPTNRSAPRYRLPPILLPEGDECDLWTDGERLTVRPVDGSQPLPGRFALPGLVDAHAHLALAPGLPSSTPLDTVVASLRLNRDAGVLLVRDVGAPRSVTLYLQAEPGLPRYQVAGRWHARKDRFFGEWHEPVEPDELLAAASAEIRGGATWVKVVADWSTPELTYPSSLLESLAETVHRGGARLAVHAQWGGVREVVAAGADSIEHGCALDAATIRAMALRGTAWTPTVRAFAAALPADAPPAAHERRAARLENYRAMLPVAAAAGVVIMAGTDTAGTVVDEVRALVEFGLSPVQALRAATTDARRFLGEGSLGDGMPADVVTFDEDPRDDPAALGRPAAVVLAGRRIA